MKWLTTAVANGLFGGGGRDRRDCKNRCKIWFSAQPDLEKACKKACKDDHNIDKDVFLCSGKYADAQVVMLSYGYDPCPGDEYNLANLLDPMGDRDRQDEEIERFQPVLIGGGLLILVALIILILVAR